MPYSGVEITKNNQNNSPIISLIWLFFNYSRAYFIILDRIIEIIEPFFLTIILTILIIGYYLLIICLLFVIIRQLLYYYVNYLLIVLLLFMIISYS